MVATRKYEDYVKAAADAGVDLIISGAGLPMTLPEFSGSAKIAPIVSSRKSLSVISKYWKKKYDRKPDLVVIEYRRQAVISDSPTRKLMRILSQKKKLR